MRTPLLLCAAALSLAPAVSAQPLPSVLLSESFETDGEGSRYTAPGSFNANIDDYFQRTDGSDIRLSPNNASGPYTNIDGTFFFAMEDIDAVDGIADKRVTFDALDVTGFSDLSLSVRVGVGNEGGPGESAYDRTDFADFRYSFDGSEFQNCLAFRWTGPFSQGDSANEPFAQDTDFDGEGDGTVLNRALQTFTCSISTEGAEDLSSLVIQGDFRFDSGQEEFAFDLVEVRGVSSDTPNVDPSASFTFSADGLTVDFTDTSSDSDGSVVSWAWSFGDGWHLDDAEPVLHLRRCRHLHRDAHRHRRRRRLRLRRAERDGDGRPRPRR